MNIDPKLIRIQYLVDKINEYIDIKGITKTELADNVGISQPAVTPYLTMKRVGTDEYYKKLMKGIPITDTQIKEIFREADREEYKFKYGVDIETPDPSFKVAFRKEFGKEPTEKDMEILKRIFNGEE